MRDGEPLIWYADSDDPFDVARCDHPGLRFEVGSMTDLDLADA